MGFISILALSALRLVMMSAGNVQAEPGQFPCGYDYIYKVGAWFKMHSQAVNRADAGYTCFLEGAQLASPSREAVKKAMLALMVNNRNKYNETSSMIVHTAMDAEEYTMEHYIDSRMYDDIRWVSIALTEIGQLQIVSQYITLPFICYKEAPQDLRFNECGTTDPRYVLDGRTNRCYKFHRTRSTWLPATQSCAAEGGYLAIINSEDEAKVIQDIFTRNPADVIPGNNSKDLAFIGFWADDKRFWRTIHGQTLSEAGYEVWSPGEPNNAEYTNFYEYCGSVARNGKLFDSHCSLWLPYICEKNIHNSNSVGCSAPK